MAGIDSHPQFTKNELMALYEALCCYASFVRAFDTGRSLTPEAKATVAAAEQARMKLACAVILPPPANK